VKKLNSGKHFFFLFPIFFFPSLTFVRSEFFFFVCFSFPFFLPCTFPWGTCWSFPSFCPYHVQFFHGPNYSGPGRVSVVILLFPGSFDVWLYFLFFLLPFAGGARPQPSGLSLIFTCVYLASAFDFLCDRGGVRLLSLQLALPCLSFFPSFFFFPSGLFLLTSVLDALGHGSYFLDTKLGVLPPCSLSSLFLT